MANKIRIKLPDGREVDATPIEINQANEYWNQYLLEDSSIIKMKLVATKIFRVDNEYDVEIIAKNPLVDRIFIIRENNTFCIWTALSKYDKDARYSLYNKELEIIKYFSPVEFQFDFHLAQPDDIEELLASGAKIIYSRTNGSYAK